MKPSKLIKQTSPAQLSEIRREITGKEYRQEHSTRDKKRLLVTIEGIELIIEKLGYKLIVMKNYYFSEFTQEDGNITAYVLDENEKAVDTIYQDIQTNEVWTHSGKGIEFKNNEWFYDGFKVKTLARQ